MRTPSAIFAWRAGGVGRGRADKKDRQESLSCGTERGFMTTQAVKVKNEESQGNAITGAAAGVGEKVTGTIASTREFLHDVRVEMKQVTWPSREDVISTTWVVIATVAFFGVFLAVVDKLVQLGVAYVFKRFGV